MPSMVVAAVSATAAPVELLTPYERAVDYFAQLAFDLTWREEAPIVPVAPFSTVHESVRTVPFYSQFADISAPEWQGVGCGIASVAMLIDYYVDTVIDVDALLADGRAAGAYLPHAGWTHQGLIDLAAAYGLTGETVSLAHLTEAAALTELEREVTEGPVMVSVHYTFEPTNPIPHLAVVTEITDGLVHYNDPAEAAGDGTISLERFSAAWKQRYISIRPQG